MTMDSGHEEEIIQEPERIPDEHFKSSKRNKLDRWLRPGFVLLLLVWGSVLLLRSIESFRGHRNDDDTGYRLPHSAFTNDGSLRVNLTTVRNSTFLPVVKSLQWISTPESQIDDNGLFVTVSDDAYVVRSVFDKDFSQVLFKGTSFAYEGANYTVESLVASPDLSKLLIRTETVSNWRHSSFGSYYVYNNGTSQLDKIGDTISLAEWSPDSINVAYVQDNDIYVYSSEKRRTISRITDDGSSQVFNGRPDWVYEEEVLEDDRALWWSPNGEFLAYFKIDESKVGEFVIPYYVQPDYDVYSELRSIKYPKSGTPNPVVELWIYDVKDSYAYPVDVGNSRQDPNDSTLVTEVTWVGDKKAIAKTSDRSSDLLTVYLIDTVARESEVVREDPSDGGWWEITHNTLYIPKNESYGRDDDGYLDIIPIEGYNHLVYYSPANSSKPKILTRGEWEVTSGPAAFDYETNIVYFISTKKSSTERHLYSVQLDNPHNLTEITDISENAVYDATFSAGSRFALLSYRGPNVPYQKIVDLKAEHRDKERSGNVVGKTLYFLEENQHLKEVIKEYDTLSRDFQQLSLGTDENGEEVVANSYEILPPDFDETKKDYYPVFFYAYGGPNSQQVLQAFSVGFNEVIASQLDAIVVVVDGRGTGFKGKKFRSLVRDRLGDYEAQDQISAAKLYGSKPYVDASKISLFGWSYGGYLTLKTLEKDAGEHFKYGLSVAPVTDWSLYDSVYTERYMHTPQANSEGYQAARVHNVTSIGKADRFLLMHGTGDDNVHFQNSLRFLDLLDLNGVENYDVHVFPDSDHSIRYHNANLIVYDKLLSWTKLAYTGHFLY